MYCCVLQSVQRCAVKVGTGRLKAADVESLRAREIHREGIYKKKNYKGV